MSVNKTNWLWILFGITIALYIISMIICPWFEGNGDWEYVQATWYSWQSFNAGVLLFFSSIVALKITIYSENEQSKRNFLAARAFLPEALSELTTYLKLSTDLLKEAWQKTKDKSKTPLTTKVPSLPASYKEIFAKLIGYAEPDVGNHLVLILVRLQVHDSRINTLSRNFYENSTNENSTTIILPQNIISYFYCLAELQVLINKTFRYARGLEEFDNSDLIWSDYLNVYHFLDIAPDEFDDLEGFTKRAIENKIENPIS